MRQLIYKELSSFFASPIAYMIIGVYLLINGLFLWVFDGDLNILHAGFADLTSYFFLAPWVFLFLIPALTMKSFADELNDGTIELLQTAPISTTKLILGKYTAAFLLIVLAILPTFIYVLSIYFLSNTVGDLDYGTIIGSFVGLLFLVLTYTAIGLFFSTTSKKQLVSFILSVFVTFILFTGFEFFASFNLIGSLDYIVELIGMKVHYASLSKGVLDTRDIIYFLSLSGFFLVLTQINLSHEK